MRPSLAVLRADFANDRDVVGWLIGASLLPGPMPAPRGLAREAAELRDAIGTCMRAAAAGAAPEPAVLTRIDDWLVLAGTRPALRPGADGLPLLGERAAADSPRRALGTLALDAAEILGRDGERERLRICEGCGDVFHDRSPAGRRRWCSMRTCGNRAKARRHRERRAA